MLNSCTCFNVQNISNKGFRIYSPTQSFSVVLCKNIFKIMHCYKKCLTDALIIVLKIFPKMVFEYTLHENVLLLFSTKGLLKLCIMINNS